MSDRRELAAIRASGVRIGGGRYPDTPTAGHHAARNLPSARNLPFKSPTHWMVLALVIERPSYGYEIGTRFERRFGMFIAVNASKIYDSLNKLEELGLIEVLSAPEQRRQKGQEGMRRYFRATGDGARAYRRWAAGALKGEAHHRTELLGRVATVGVLGLRAMLDVVERHEQECLSEAEEIELPAIDESIPLRDDLSDLAAVLVAEQQRLAIEAELAWVAFARRQIEVREQRRNAARDGQERQG